MTELVVALLMIVNGEIKEARIQLSMSDCLKGKRVAKRSSKKYRWIFFYKKINIRINEFRTTG